MRVSGTFYHIFWGTGFSVAVHFFLFLLLLLLNLDGSLLQAVFEQLRQLLHGLDDVVRVLGFGLGLLRFVVRVSGIGIRFRTVEISCDPGCETLGIIEEAHLGRKENNY